MKYVVLIHANPQPWGHPVEDYLPEYHDMDPKERERRRGEFEALLGTLYENGELVGGEALADPHLSTVYRWDSNEPTGTDGPYAETKEHLAGYFLIDVEDQQRARNLASKFAGPGEVVELRPLMSQGEDD